jgi:hypothetical protein
VYLVIVAVDTPGVRLPLDSLRRALYASAAASDSLQHAFLDSNDGATTFSLYVTATDEPTAVRLADQLCRRTMATVCPGRWRVQSARLGL